MEITYSEVSNKCTSCVYSFKNIYVPSEVLLDTLRLLDIYSREGKLQKIGIH